MGATVLEERVFDLIVNSEQSSRFEIAAAVAEAIKEDTKDTNVWWCAKHQTAVAMPAGSTMCAALNDGTADRHKAADFGCGMHALIKISEN